MTSISVAESVTIDAAPSDVWALVTDPQQVVVCLPGASVIEERADGVIEGSIATRLGPTVVTFRGLVTPEFDHESRTGKLVAQGSDKLGRSQAAATVGFDVGAASDTTTSFAVRGDIELIGPLSGFLATGGAHIAQQMLKDFAGAVSARFAVPAAGAADRQAAEPAQPSGRPISAFRMLRLAIVGAFKTLWRRLTSRGGAPGG